MSSEYFIRYIKSVSQNDLELNIYQCFPFLVMWPHAFSLLANHKHLLFALSFFISPSLTSVLLRVWIHSLVSKCICLLSTVSLKNWSKLINGVSVPIPRGDSTDPSSQFTAILFCSVFPLTDSFTTLLSCSFHPINTHSQITVLKVILKWDRNLTYSQNKTSTNDENLHRRVILKYL